MKQKKMKKKNQQKITHTKQTFDVYSSARKTPNPNLFLLFLVESRNS